MYKILFTICGRKGSKGLKNKNIRPFLGVPLVKYTLAAAKLFSKKMEEYDVDICVNSDSLELLSISGNVEDVILIQRPDFLGEDSTPKMHVIKQSVTEVETMRNKKYDFIIDLDITSPLRRVEDIISILNINLNSSNIDLVFSVVPSRRSPYFNMVERVEGKINRVKASNYVTRQEAPDVYDMNASIYCFKRDSLDNNFDKSPFDGGCEIFIMQDTCILDIDSAEDFDIMELLVKHYFNKQFMDIIKEAKSLN